jgi:hypothetical protein
MQKINTPQSFDRTRVYYLEFQGTYRDVDDYWTYFRKRSLIQEYSLHAKVLKAPLSSLAPG